MRHPLSRSGGSATDDLLQTCRSPRRTQTRRQVSLTSTRIRISRRAASGCHFHVRQSVPGGMEPDTSKQQGRAN
jgi:hypothetical protein